MTAPPRLTDDERERFCRALEASSSPVTLSPFPNPELLALIPGCDPETPLRHFNGAAIWSQLSPEQQAAFGAAALELAVARFGVEVSRDEREERMFLAAEAAATSAIDEHAITALFDSRLVPPDQVPGIPSLLGPVCRECGHSEYDTCWIPPWDLDMDGCAWVEPDLCADCADAQVRPRTAPALESAK